MTELMDTTVLDRQASVDRHPPDAPVQAGAGEALRDRILAIARAPEWFNIADPEAPSLSMQIDIRPVLVSFAAQDLKECTTVTGTIDDRPFVLSLPLGCAALWVERREPLIAWDTLDESRRAEVAEYMFSGLIGLLETRAGRRISLHTLKPESAAVQAPNFGFVIRLDGLVLPALGRFDPQTLLGLARWAGDRSRRPTPKLAVPATIRRGFCRLTLQELRALSVGDGIVIDPIEPGLAILVVGERLAATCRLEAERAVLLHSPTDTLVGPMRHWMNNDVMNLDFADAPGEGGVESIPIKVVFDVGRFELPVSQVAAMKEGHVFNLDRWPRALVDIVAQGKIIGRGEIIEHEALYAVRVTSLMP